MVVPKKDGEAPLGVVVNGEYSLSPAGECHSKVEGGGALPHTPFRFAIAMTVAIDGSMVHGGRSMVKSTYPLVSFHKKHTPVCKVYIRYI